MNQKLTSTSLLRPLHKLPIVYVLRTPDFEFIKVGKSQNFKGRLSNIQSGCPLQLFLWCGVYTPNPRPLEAELHAALAHIRVRGEWFKPSGADLDFIIDFCQKRNRQERATHALLQA